MMETRKDVFNLEKIYTCKGKGGQYQPVATVKAAGTLRNLSSQYFVIYQDVNSREIYVRTEQDFLDRMEVLE